MNDAAKAAYDEKTLRYIEEVCAAENEMLSRRQSAGEVECPCRDGMFPRHSTTRRAMLFAAGTAAGGGAASLLSRRAVAAEVRAPAGAVHFDVPADPTKELGRPASADGGYDTRSQFETEVRERFSTANAYTTWTFTPLEKMLGNLTASGLHFERHHAGAAKGADAEPRWVHR